MSLKHCLDTLQSLLASQLPCPVISGRPEQSLGLYLFPWHISQSAELRNARISLRDAAETPCSLKVVLLPKADSIAIALDLLDQAMTVIQAHPVQTNAENTVQLKLDTWSPEMVMQFFQAAALPLQSAIACELRAS